MKGVVELDGDNVARSPFGIMQIYLDITESMIKGEAFLIHMVHAVLLNFQMEHWRKQIYDEHTLEEMISAEYGGGDDVEFGEV